MSTSWVTLSAVGHLAADECPADGVRIKASDPNPFDTFGFAVGISGNTAVIGAIWDDQNGLDAGAAYVFTRENQNWVQTQKLIASDGEGSDWFGRALVVGGTTIFVASNQGKVYVYDRDGERWTEVQQLMPSDAPAGDSGGFGWSIAASADTAIMGAPSADADDGFISGAAYVFRFDSKRLVWIEETKLLPSDLPPVPGLGFGFGSFTALHGDVAVVGAPGDNSACPDNLICSSGAVYVFRYDVKTENWFQTDKLLASDAACGDDFGKGVALGEDVALLAAPFDDDLGAASGSVYVFRFDPESWEWVEEQKLVASDGLPGDQFGRALAMDGDLAVIGAWLADPVGNSSGAAYAFRRGPDGVWTEECKLLPEPNGTTQIFGKAIAVDCGRVIIGSKGEDNQSGAAYIYELPTNPADLNNDCDVGAFDLAQLLASWGPCPKLCTPGDPTNTCPADLNGDCTVGPTDLATLLGSWGT